MPMPPFVTHLRSVVGNELLWLPGVSGVVISDDGHLLMARRVDSYQWAVVSGVLDPGEQPALGIVREIFEETGVLARVEAVTSIHSGEPVAYPNGDRAQYLDITFLCSVVTGDAFVADDENVEVGWFPPEALPIDTMPASRLRVAHALEFLTNPARGPWFVAGEA